jgi:hypothetical protein
MQDAYNCSFSVISTVLITYKMIINGCMLTYAQHDVGVCNNVRLKFMISNSCRCIDVNMCFVIPV